MFRLWFTLHVLSAVALMGASFAFPFVGVVIKKGGDKRTGVKIIQTVAKRLLYAGDVMMPVTGTLMILSSHGAFNPLHRENRWLLSGIILFVVILGLAHAVQMPLINKAVKLADAGNTGPEFDQLVEKSEKVGPILGLLTVAIVVLMAWRPGF